MNRTAEATSPELRHAWVIAVAPEIADGATTPTDQQKADAKAKADQALADLKAGQKWEDVAKSVSTDTSTSAQGGDLGWITKDAGLDSLAWALDKGQCLRGDAVGFFELLDKYIDSQMR